MAVFFTGFPGFLGSELVERLVKRGEDVTCLVQSKYRDRAEARAARIARSTGDECSGSVELVEGDITKADLGLGAAYEERQDETDEVFHLAAVYDLGVDREVGMAVNVDGTRNVLDFAEGCDLDRFQYVSTCYVSGRYDGRFTGDDLVEGQRFNNFYETTKYLAEVEVQDRMADGLPATVYRPAIVVGDSDTGATQKYDGPYYLLRWLLRQPSVATVNTVLGASDCELNVVPRDFVVDAIVHLSDREDAVGDVYQLCDPDPLTVAEMVDVLADATDRRVFRVPLPKCAVKGALEVVPGARRLTGIEPATIDYFDHPTRYDGEATRDALAGTDVECPPFASYVDEMVAFVRDHPDITPDAMV
ncbi:SDR family oxidoreductase [Halomicrococcus sp. SG-WS-1]|uniref:SDR family oxidoreductase n=1 Tax=Halomicrococcus sp. SG-WS-1 TaxID=3439057 RepID=UPI003F7A9684